MKLLTLDDIRPTPEETELTQPMPEQVAVGFIRARRKDQQAKRGASLRKYQESGRAPL